MSCFGLLQSYLLMSTLVGGSGTAFELASPDAVATILVPVSEPHCVQLAAEDLAGDVEKVAGRRPAVVRRIEDAAADCVVVLSVDRPESRRLLDQLLPTATRQLRDKWEAFRVEAVVAQAGPVRRALVIAGSDPRGAMFGLYRFSEQYLSVDPMYFWTGRNPPPRDQLAWKEVHIESGEPTFRYRGWFINDEDLLTEWHLDGGKRDIDYPYYSTVTSPKASQPVMEAALRLGYNLIIPASFVDIRNPDEARLVDEAASRGLFISQHHVEPLGVSGFAFTKYWRERGEQVPFSYIRHPEKFEQIWREYVRLWARYPNVVWQLGLRGIADRPVWVSDPAAPKTDEDRGRLISEAMAKQWEIVTSIDQRPQPPATTTLWMEGSALHARGYLKFPPGVAVIFADNSPGWKLQADFYEVAREPGRPYGVYYHQALWGSGPHLVQAVSPQKMHSIFRQVVARGSTHYALFNVSNVREFALGVDAAAQLTRDFAVFDPDRFLHQWCAARFAPVAGQAEECYRRFFDSYVVDPDENTRHLLDGEIVNKGKRHLAQVLKSLEAGDRRIFESPENVERLVADLRQHRQSIEAAGAEADAVLAGLAGDDRRFFQVNFVVQQQILLGLIEWFENVALASLALEQQDFTEAVARLETGQAAWERVRSAQALASEGKWEHWYRGDRKMNLKAAEEATAKLLAAVRNSQ